MDKKSLSFIVILIIAALGLVWFLLIQKGREESITAENFSSQFGSNPENSNQSRFTGPQTNKVKWIFKDGVTACGFQTIMTSPVLDKNGNLYFGTSEGSLISLAPDKTVRWKFKIPDAYPRNNCSAESGEGGGLDDYNIEFAPAIDKTGTIYFGTSGAGNAKRIYALSQDGKEKWRYDIDGPLQSAVKIGYNGKLYFTTNTSLYSLETDGQKARKFTISSRRNYPAIGKSGTIYVCSGNDLLALDSNLKLKWRFSTGSTLRHCSPAIDPGSEVVYFTANNKDQNTYRLYAVNPDGTKKWTASIFWSEASPAVAKDGTIYVGTTDLSVNTKIKTYQSRGSGELFAINPNGAKKWSFNVKPVLVCKKGQDEDCLDADRWSSGTAIDLSPTIGADGTIYFGTDGQTYFSLNQNGTVKWTYRGGDEWDNSGVIASDGTLYIAPRGLIHGGLFSISD
ncbi:MAG: PQQ-like beta-propeller repeat protein [Parcubacteria group bacterium]|nr:PQQ-like beta-propeller repeat protein [Parcubacteria group bacterium]